MRRLRLRDYIPPGEFCHFAVDTFDAKSTGSLHCHDFVELFWIEHGRGIHWINGTQRELHPRQLVCIRANDQHTIGSREGASLRIVNIAFATKTWEYIRRRYLPRQRDLFDPSSIEQREYLLNEPLWSELNHASAELRSGQRTRRAIERFLLNLCHLIMSDDAHAGGTPLPHWLADACRIMSSPEGFWLSTSGIADRVGKSAEHLARALRKHIGRTPTELMNDARMCHAARRLTQTREPILDVIAETGLHNVSHFYRVFHRRFGISPHRYRLRHNQLLAPR